MKDAIVGLQLSLKSIQNRCSDVSVPKMKALLSLVINVGLIPLPDTKTTGLMSGQHRYNFLVMCRNCIFMNIMNDICGENNTKESSLVIIRAKKVQGATEHIETHI
jgi:hypothetical protein